jgi:phosphatidate cytidylyltransferase
MQLELKQRVVSAAILGTAVLILAYVGGLPFKLFAGALALLIYREWTGMVRSRSHSSSAHYLGWAVTVAVVLFTLAGSGVGAVAMLFAGTVAVAALSWRTGMAAWIAGGVVYAGFSGLAIAEIRDDGTVGLIAIAFVFAIVWATDILAYFCGRAIGGAKLAPKISPGKTWSGAVFGMFAGMAAGTGVALVVMAGGGLWITVLAAILSICSQAGDLFESWIKRKFGVKDSGRLIPGHGGVMDRVDGLVFAAFAAFLIAVIRAGGIPVAETGSPVARSLLGL